MADPGAGNNCRAESHPALLLHAQRYDDLGVCVIPLRRGAAGPST
jgi:hypothetical protein